MACFYEKYLPILSFKRKLVYHLRSILVNRKTATRYADVKGSYSHFVEKLLHERMDGITKTCKAGAQAYTGSHSGAMPNTSEPGIFAYT